MENQERIVNMEDRETGKLKWEIPSLVEFTKLKRPANGFRPPNCENGPSATDCSTGYGASVCSPNGAGVIED